MPKLGGDHRHGQFKGLRCFCLDGTDHPDHDTQTRLIHNYIDWRNAHRDHPNSAT
jgi:hypothetical protein